MKRMTIEKPTGEMNMIELAHRLYGARTNEGPCKKISGAKTR